MSVLLVGAGAAVGGVMRYLLSATMNPVAGFPLGTFVVNVVGSLAIGLLTGALGHLSAHTEAYRAFAVIGFCGGFTTFSTFSNETLRLLETNQWLLAGVYVMLSCVLGIAAAWFGYWIAR